MVSLRLLKRIYAKRSPLHFFPIYGIIIIHDFIASAFITRRHHPEFHNLLDAVFVCIAQRGGCTRR